MTNRGFAGPRLIAEIVLSAIALNLSLGCNSGRSETRFSGAAGGADAGDGSEGEPPAGPMTSFDSGAEATSIAPSPEASPTGTTTPPPAPEPSSSSETPAPTPTGPEPCQLEFSVETADFGSGQRNEGAIWITDAAGVAIRVLKGWWRRSPQSSGLGRLTSSLGYDGRGIGLLSHQAHSVTWDCRDSHGNVVPFGTYVVHVEVASRNPKPAPYFAIPFAHTGTTPLEESVASIRGFKGATLSYRPDNGRSGTPPEPMCTEFSTRAADWCESTTSCPGALEQTTCWTNYEGRTLCACSATSGFQQFRVLGITASDACASAREECRNPSPVGPKECEPRLAVAKDNCSLTRECWLPSTRNGITFARSSASTVASCGRGDDPNMNCSCSGPVFDSFTFTLGSGVSTIGLCEEVMNVCDEDVAFENPSCTTISSEASNSSCYATRECTRTGVTASGKVVRSAPDSYSAGCSRPDATSPTWLCACNGVEVAPGEGDDGLVLCEQTVERCSPN